MYCLTVSEVAESIAQYMRSGQPSRELTTYRVRIAFKKLSKFVSQTFQVSPICPQSVSLILKILTAPLQQPIRSPMSEIPKIANINLEEKNKRNIIKSNFLHSVFLSFIYQMRTMTIRTLKIPETDSKSAMTTTLRLTLCETNRRGRRVLSNLKIFKKEIFTPNDNKIKFNKITNAHTQRHSKIDSFLLI